MEFFDDFTQLEPEATQDSAMESLEGLLRLLGWTVATAESKRLPFDSQFVSLGVKVDLSRVDCGEVVLTHKPGRIDNFEAQVKSIIDKGSMDFRDAMSVRGKVYFSEGQVFGRMSARIIHMLSRWRTHRLGVDPWQQMPWQQTPPVQI